MRKEGLNSFHLKLIAIVGMFLQHFAIGFRGVIPQPIYYICNFFGGFTYPIMAFLMYYGYKHTRSLKKYFIRLLIFAVLTQIPYSLYFEIYMLNIMFSMMLGLTVLYSYDKYGNCSTFKLLTVGLGILSMFMDWSVYGVIMFYIIAVAEGDIEKIRNRFIVLFTTVILIQIVGLFFDQDVYENIAFFTGSVFSVFLYRLYNGKRGLDIKYFFYLFYPGHLLILHMLKTFLMNRG